MPASIPVTALATAAQGAAVCDRGGSRYIVGMRVDAGTYDIAGGRIIEWAARGESRYVCVATVHMVMESHDDASFRAIVNGADLVTSDGMPLVWALRLLGVSAAERVCGPKLMPMLCARAAEQNVPIGLYGGTPDILRELQLRLLRRYPSLTIAYRYSPPFRPLTDGEHGSAAAAINASGTRLLFVGIGCPKQERWMHAMRGRIAATSVGVGAAFDFLAGRKRRAPEFMMPLGLEWLFRLASEPRRLWKRYLYHNPRFLARFSAQLARECYPLRSSLRRTCSRSAIRSPERSV